MTAKRPLLVLTVATLLSLEFTGRAAGRDEHSGLSGSFGVGTLSFRGDDVGSGLHTGIVTTFALGARLAGGFRPELDWRFASFGASASAKETNVIVVAPGLRWYASSGRIQPWLGAHFDFAWFSFGGTCTYYDVASGYVSAPQRGCNDNGGYFGFDLAGGVDWRIGGRWSLGTQLSWARVAPTSPPKQLPALAGYPQPELPSLTRTWIAWTFAATFTL